MNQLEPEAPAAASAADDRTPADSGRSTDRGAQVDPENGAGAERAAGPRLRIDLAYDGTDFSGWAVQPTLRTVQGVLEDALATIAREPLRVVVAGRTDAGVHALGQVCHVDVREHALRTAIRRAPREEAEVAFARRLRGVLTRADDIEIVRVSVAPDGFDARFSALSRSYEYRIAAGGEGRSPLTRRHTAVVDEPLDLDAMNRAASLLVGLADFAAFCKPRAGATTVRELQALGVERAGDGAIRVLVAADAFCHSMVRALVGGLVAVGSHRLTAADLVRLRDERRRTSAFRVMPAHGLTLMAVQYPRDGELAARASLTRALRETP